METETAEDAEKSQVERYFASVLKYNSFQQSAVSTVMQSAVLLGMKLDF